MRWIKSTEIRGRGAAIAIALLLCSNGGAAFAQGEPANLFDLLELVRGGLRAESEENKARELTFVNHRNDQQRLLAEARALLISKEEFSQQLENQYADNENRLGELEARLAENLGQMGELFGVVRQVANDTSGQVWDSLTSSQLPPRKELLDRLGRSKALPSTRDLEALWYELQVEMTQQGQVVRYNAPVLTLEGNVETREVIRAGPFSAVSRGRYLLWAPAQEKLIEMQRQPPSRYLQTVAPFESTQSGFAPLALDPSRGSLLGALTQTPNMQERVGQGGAVGMVILVLGALGLTLGFIRWISLLWTSAKVRAQQKNSEPNEGNPLGRVLAIFDQNKEMDAETLELKLDEAVLRETSQLERFLWIVKTISVVAPLLGLLGTVTGMIQTFQAITLFGAGDPKMMAGGISEALVTTMLGLTTAIPLVLLYDTLANSSKRITEILDEQGAGLIAARAEADPAAMGARRERG